MTLAEQFASKFRADVRFRGEAYLKAERVSLMRITADQIAGLVRDGVEYETQLSREDGQLKMYCNCSVGTQAEPTCKHLWATILAVDEGGFLTASAKPNYVPPFASEPASTDFEDWEDDNFEGDVFQPSAAGARPTGTRVKVELRDWEARLVDLRERLTAADPTARSTSEREVYYELDVEQSREAEQLVIQTSQRQRRANGQWGKLKPLKLRPGQLDDIEHEDDRRILAYLAGGTPVRTNWYAQQAETQSLVHRYHVPHELAERILPLICETGRIRLMDRDARNAKPLAWDEQAPWELTLRVEQDEPEAAWRVVGVLRRGDEVQSLSDVEVIVPGGLVVTGSTISRLHDFDAFGWVSMLRQEESLNVSDSDKHELVERLLDMPVLPRLELPEELQLEQIECEPSFHLTVKTPRSGRWHMERLKGEVSFDYIGTMIRGASMQWAIVQREAGQCILRNRSREEDAWLQLQEQGFRRLLDPRHGGHDVEINVRDLGPAVRSLVGRGWQVHADGKQVRQPLDMRFRIESGIDWFELHADIDFEGHSIAFPELLSALARGDSTVRLDDGSLGILPEDWARRYGLLAGLGVADGEHMRFEQHQVALLDALLASRDTVDFDARFAELRERFSSFDGIEPSGEPSGFEGALRGYQKEGLGWLEFLQSFGLGGCLADDMGLGKTVQLLALLQDRKNAGEKRPPSLVVVPKSLMFNWFQECHRFTPELKVLEYVGLDRTPLRKDFKQYDLILTTYGTLRRDILELKDMPFDYVVLDEAQTIKNSGSQVAKASRLLRANYRVALSGTPIENHLGDLWSIFEFLNPGMLGRSSIFQSFANDSEDQQARGLLSRALQPFILRRTKRQVASELPEKLEQTIHCDMPPEQRKLYDELRDHYRSSLMGLVRDQGLAKSRMHVLEALLRLRQAACHPALLDRSEATESSAKLDVLCPYLEELLEEGHKTLVFSQFTSLLAIVKQHLDERGIVYEYLDGQTRNRKDHVERFQNDPDCGVFLISLKAGGLGLNLTAADYVFLLDPWWNPAVEAQAIDRAHRVGQTKKVFAFRLICRDTVEEKIAELQGRKQELADAILQADKSLLKGLSTDDLEMLLS